MRVVALLSCLVLFSCCGKPIHDPLVSPSSINQMRLVMDSATIDSDTIDSAASSAIYSSKDVGVMATTAKEFKFMTYGKGTYSIRGFYGCGGHFGGSFKNTKWVTISPPSTDPFCLMQIEVKESRLDSNISGAVFIRPFTNVDVKPMQVMVNNRAKEGVNAIQVAEQDGSTIRSFYNNEDPKVAFITKSQTGWLKTKSSCKDKKGNYLTDLFPIVNGRVDTDLFYLYRNAGGVNQSCLFEALVNPDDANKEGGTLYVHVYQGFGSWLETPLVESQGNKKCFEFIDPYVVGILINNKASKINRNSLCVSKADTYEVLAITSNLRLFYGVFEDKINDWGVIK